MLLQFLHHVSWLGGNPFFQGEASAGEARSSQQKQIQQPTQQ